MCCQCAFCVVVVIDVCDCGVCVRVVVVVLFCLVYAVCVFAFCCVDVCSVRCCVCRSCCVVFGVVVGLWVCVVCLLRCYVIVLMFAGCGFVLCV